MKPYTRSWEISCQAEIIYICGNDNQDNTLPVTQHTSHKTKVYRGSISGLAGVLIPQKTDAEVQFPAERMFPFPRKQKRS